MVLGERLASWAHRNSASGSSASTEQNSQPRIRLRRQSIDQFLPSARSLSRVSLRRRTSVDGDSHRPIWSRKEDRHLSSLSSVDESMEAGKAETPGPSQSETSSARDRSYHGNVSYSRVSSFSHVPPRLNSANIRHTRSSSSGRDTRRSMRHSSSSAKGQQSNADNDLQFSAGLLIDNSHAVHEEATSAQRPIHLNTQIDSFILDKDPVASPVSRIPDGTPTPTSAVSASTLRPDADTTFTDFPESSLLDDPSLSQNDTQSFSRSFILNPDQTPRSSAVTSSKESTVPHSHKSKKFPQTRELLRNATKSWSTGMAASYPPPTSASQTAPPTPNHVEPDTDPMNQEKQQQVTPSLLDLGITLDDNCTIDLACDVVVDDDLLQESSKSASLEKALRSLGSRVDLQPDIVRIAPVPWSASKPANLHKAEQVMNELCDTEVRFYIKLRSLEEDFYEPLRLYAENPQTAVIKMREVEVIFWNIKRLVSLAHGFSTELRAIVDERLSSKTWGARIFAHISRLKDTFRKSLFNSRASSDLHRALMRRNQQYALFVERAQLVSRERTGCAEDLGDLLAEPFQRAARYQLLLSTVLKHLDPHDQNARGIEQSMAILNEVCSMEMNKSEHDVAVKWAISYTVDGWVPESKEPFSQGQTKREADKRQGTASKERLDDAPDASTPYTATPSDTEKSGPIRSVPSVSSLESSGFSDSTPAAPSARSQSASLATPVATPNMSPSPVTSSFPDLQMPGFLEDEDDSPPMPSFHQGCRGRYIDSVDVMEVLSDRTLYCTLLLFSEAVVVLKRPADRNSSQLFGFNDVSRLSYMAYMENLNLDNPPTLPFGAHARRGPDPSIKVPIEESENPSVCPSRPVLGNLLNTESHSNFPPTPSKKGLNGSHASSTDLRCPRAQLSVDTDLPKFLSAEGKKRPGHISPSPITNPWASARRDIKGPVRKALSYRGTADIRDVAPVFGPGGDPIGVFFFHTPEHCSSEAWANRPLRKYIPDAGTSASDLANWLLKLDEFRSAADRPQGKANDLSRARLSASLSCETLGWDLAAHSELFVPDKSSPSPFPVASRHLYVSPVFESFMSSTPNQRIISRVLSRSLYENMLPFEKRGRVIIHFSSEQGADTDAVASAAAPSAGGGLILNVRLNEHSAQCFSHMAPDSSAHVFRDVLLDSLGSHLAHLVISHILRRLRDDPLGYTSPSLRRKAKSRITAVVGAISHKSSMMNMKASSGAGSGSGKREHTFSVDNMLPSPMDSAAAQSSILFPAQPGSAEQQSAFTRTPPSTSDGIGATEVLTSSPQNATAPSRLGKTASLSHLPKQISSSPRPKSTSEPPKRKITTAASQPALPPKASSRVLQAQCSEPSPSTHLSQPASNLLSAPGSKGRSMKASQNVDSFLLRNLNHPNLVDQSSELPTGSLMKDKSLHASTESLSRPPSEHLRGPRSLPVSASPSGSQPDSEILTADDIPSSSDFDPHTSDSSLERDDQFKHFDATDAVKSTPAPETYSSDEDMSPVASRCSYNRSSLRSRTQERLSHSLSSPKVSDPRIPSVASMDSTDTLTQASFIKLYRNLLKEVDCLYDTFDEEISSMLSATSDSSDAGLREQLAAALRQRNNLMRELEFYRRASQMSNRDS